ncbi:MAG: class I SAM-dependent methyltransferase [Gammaproteobacteria bacterium]|nr:class I SAM-dependent methyltransferase [Gammaproteobacteria bacterium]
MRYASRRRVKGKPLAEQADRHELYQMAVQSPDTEIPFLLETYERLRGKAPGMLREDFCGTAYLATEWCKRDRSHRALGIDLDGETLAWGRRHNVEPAGADVVDRLTLVHGDVRDVVEPAADIACAFNFSYCVLESRDDLKGYFETVHRGLASDGLFVLDLFGGTEVYEAQEEETEIDDSDVVYVWDQAAFNPIDHHMECRIHFNFPDGSRMEDAFSYSWRLWVMPEITDLLYEAGFTKVRVFWEGFEEPEDADDEYLDSTGEYEEVTEVENQDSWMSYIVAER